MKIEETHKEKYQETNRQWNKSNKDMFTTEELQAFGERISRREEVLPAGWTYRK